MGWKLSSWHNFLSLSMQGLPSPYLPYPSFPNFSPFRLWVRDQGPSTNVKEATVTLPSQCSRPPGCICGGWRRPNRWGWGCCKGSGSPSLWAVTAPGECRSKAGCRSTGTRARRVEEMVMMMLQERERTEVGVALSRRALLAHWIKEKEGDYQTPSLKSGVNLLHLRGAPREQHF